MDAADWDARYAGSDLVWSAGPNMFVTELFSGMPCGRVLDVAAGEGRNAIWLAEQGWQVTATDFSTVAVDRMRTIAAQRLDANATGRFTAVLADAAAGAPGVPGSYDAVLFCYLHLPAGQWRAALAAGVEAAAPGAAIVIIAHALRNLTEGVGGPQDPEVLLDPADVVASAQGLPVMAEVVEMRRREVPTEVGHQLALDTVVVLRRLPAG